MAVMYVRKVCVRMSDRCMVMSVRVRLDAVPLELVRVLVVFVVFVGMIVSKFLVDMRVLVSLANVKPYPYGHEGGSNPEVYRRQFRPDEQRNHDAEYRSN